APHEIFREPLYQPKRVLAVAMIGDEVSGGEDRRQRRLELADLVGIEDVDAKSRRPLQIDAEFVVLEPLLASVDEELPGLMEKMLEAGISKQRAVCLESRHVEARQRPRDALDPVAPAGAQKFDKPRQHMGQV